MRLRALNGKRRRGVGACREARGCPPFVGSRARRSVPRGKKKTLNTTPQEAIRLKEAGTATEVVAVSVGPKECQVRER